MYFGTKLIKAIQELDPKAREAFILLMEDIQRHLKVSVTKEEFREFAKQTQENFNKVWEAINELTAKVAQLAERMNQLAEAQRRTEERLERLIGEHRKTRENLGGLAETFGYYLENKAIHRLPKYLKEKHGIEVIEPLQRLYLKVNKTYIEVNIYGKVKRNGVEYILLGEAKNRITHRGIEQFLRKCRKIGGNQIRVLVAHVLPPQLEEKLTREDIIFVNSYEIDY